MTPEPWGKKCSVGPGYANCFVDFIEHQLFSQYNGPKPELYAAFKAVLLRKYREMHSDVWGAIDEQLLPRDIDEEVKQQYHFIDIGWIG